MSRFNRISETAAQACVWLLSLCLAGRVCVYAFSHTETLLGGVAASMFFVPLALIPGFFLIGPLSIAFGFAIGLADWGRRSVKRARA